MNARILVILAMFLGMGTVLHFVMPPIFGVTPDMLLTFMFLGIVLFPDKKNVLLLGIGTGILAALTTAFPMGQIPNLIDKPISAFVFFALFLVLGKKANNPLSIAILGGVMTIVSGVLFLGSAYFLFELPGPFVALFASAVLPTALINTVLLFILYPIVKNILLRSKIIQNNAA